MKKIDNKGMTLIELITALAISVVIGAVVLGLLVSSMKIYNQYQINNLQNILFENISEIVSDEIRYASSLVISDESYGTYSSDYTSLDVAYSQIVRNETDTLISDTTFEKNTIQITFDLYQEESSIICFTICLDQGTEYEASNTYTVRLVNMELNNAFVLKQVDASGTRVYYQEIE